MELARTGRPVRAIHRAGSDLQRVRRLFAWYGPELAMAWDAIQWVEAELSDLPALEAALAGAHTLAPASLAALCAHLRGATPLTAHPAPAVPVPAPSASSTPAPPRSMVEVVSAT